MRWSARVTEPAPKIIDSPRFDQLQKRSSMRLSEQRPGVDDAVILNNPRPGTVASIESHQSHAARA